MKNYVTRDMCYAAGRDAGNRSMRKAGRRKWNHEDFNNAAKEFYRLLPFANCNYEVETMNYELSTRAAR